MTLPERRRNIWSSPLFLCILSVVMTVGFDALGNIITTWGTTIDKRFDVIDQKLVAGERSGTEQVKQEARDYDCLRLRIERCCGSKADVEC